MRAILRAVARALRAMAQIVMISVAVMIDGVIRVIRVAQRALVGNRQPDFEAPEPPRADQAAVAAASVAQADDGWSAVRSAAAAWYGGHQPQPENVARVPAEVDEWLSKLDREQMYIVATTPTEQLRGFFKGHLDIEPLPLPAHLERRNTRVQALIAEYELRKSRERTDALLAMINDPDSEDAEYRYAGV